MHLLPRYSFLRFLPSVAVFLFSAVVGVSFAAWLDAPNAPPNYGIVGCIPPCSQDDFKPMNLGTTPQIKHADATFEGNLTARKFLDYDGSAYFIDPASGVEAGNLSGKLTVGGEVHANGFYDAQGIGYFIDPADASGYSGLFAGKVGIRQQSPRASLAVNNPATTDKYGSTNDAIYAYTNSTNAAVSAEQANAAGYAIYASGGINYFGGNVGIGTTASATYALNVAGDANATRLCIAGDCKSGWPSGVWTQTGNNIYNNNTGLVGIGTATPSSTLDVAGGIHAYSLSVDNNISAGGDVTATGNANATQLCIAGDCKSSWYTAGTGISISDSTISAKTSALYLCPRLGEICSSNTCFGQTSTSDSTCSFSMYAGCGSKETKTCTKIGYLISL